LLHFKCLYFELASAQTTVNVGSGTEQVDLVPNPDFYFCSANGNKNTNNNNDGKADTRSEHLHVLSFLCVS